MSAIIKNIKINRNNAGKAAALYQLSQTFKSIFETSEKIFGTICMTSVNNNRTSVNNNRTSVNNSRTSVNNNRTSVNNNRTSVNNNRTSVNNNRTSVNNNRTSVNSNRTSVRKKTSFNKNNSTLRQISKSPEIREIISNTDEYLHYANEILYYISNTSETSKLILFRINSSGQLTGIIIIIFNNADKPVFFICRIENAKIFDGVIERYCGVPP